MITALGRAFAGFSVGLLGPEARKDSGDVLLKLNDETLWEGFSEELADILINHLGKAGRVGTESAANQLGINLSWDYLNPRVSDWARAYAGQLVTFVTQGTKERVRQIVTEALQSGAGWRTVREKLTGEFSRARAERIARTEVIRAHTQGALLGYEESGVVRGLQWLDGQNGACPLCRELHQQTRPLGKVFYTDRFGDGHPPRHPNCRCAESPVTLEMTKSLPEDHPLRDNRRDSLAELTDRETFTEIAGVRINGERRQHWRYQHGEKAAELEGMLETILRDGTPKNNNGKVLTYPRDEKTTYVIPLGWDAPRQQWFLMSLYFRRKRQVDNWAQW